MRAGEFGVQLQIQTSFDLTGSTDVLIRWKDPRVGEPVEEREIDPPPPSGSVVTYVTEDGDFPAGGAYQFMVQAQFGATKRLRSKIVQLVIDNALEVMS